MENGNDLRTCYNMTKRENLACKAVFEFSPIHYAKQINISTINICAAKNIPSYQVSA